LWSFYFQSQHASASALPSSFKLQAVVLAAAEGLLFSEDVFAFFEF
jgi:hypothetical protein